MSSVGRKGGCVAVASMMLWASLLTVGLTVSNEAAAGTVVSGHITTNTTWTLSNSPYWVIDTVTVDGGATLTIEAGVTVKFEFNAWPPYSLVVYGELRALGNTSGRVTFTSNLTSPAVPSWGNITIKDTGKAEILHTDVSFGEGLGLFSSRGNSIRHSRFLNNVWAISVFSDDNTLYDNTYKGNTKTALNFHGYTSNNKVSYSNISYNRGIGIILQDGPTSKSKIYSNWIVGNQDGGIVGRLADGWEIDCNLISANAGYGLRLETTNITVHHNNIMNHSDNAWDDEWWTLWDTGKEGNYWDDYNGSDTDGDGIGETPYYIQPKNQDSYPFVNPVPGCPSGGPSGQPPVAVAHPDHQIVNIGQSAWFNGNDSYDPDGWIVSYYWLFGDGGSAYGVNVSHAYSSPGQYTVTLTVTDNESLKDSDSVSVTVLGYYPVADAGPSQTVYVNELVIFNGSGSYDPDGWIVDWTWDFGDGSPGKHGEVVNHTYTSTGVYTATLWVKDNDNLTDSDTTKITVLPELVPPVSDADGPYSGRKNHPVTMTGNGSYDPDGVIIDLEWDFGDGSPKEHGWWVRHVYSSGGVFLVTLTVMDDDNLTDTDTTYANITDESPGAPGIQNAALSGVDLDDVAITWSASPDDGGAENDVTAYEIYYGTSYDSNGNGYSLLDTVPAGSTSWTHVGGGQSDTNTYFYLVRAIDDIGQKAFNRQAIKFSRHLAAGMELISIPVVMSDTGIQTVFQTADINRIIYYDAMAGKRHNWKTFDTRKPYNSLTDVDETMALWIDVKSDSHLIVAGLVPAETTISLVVGWNFVGYASFTDSAMGTTLAGAKKQKVEGYDSSDPPWYLRKLSESDIMSFGNGYWIHVSEDFLWTVTN